jgi:hypothetical protein
MCIREQQGEEDEEMMNEDEDSGETKQARLESNVWRAGLFAAVLVGCYVLVVDIQVGYPTSLRETSVELFIIMLMTM